MFDWLCAFSNGDVEKYFRLMKPGDPGVPPGIPFAMIDFPQRIDNVKSSDTSMGPGWMGTFVVNKMIEVGKKFGVEVLTEHKAERLLLDENGAFAGVVASNPGGEITIHAKGCVIASGSIVTNTTLEVVREDGDVIPGIWAVGDSCKGLFQKDDRGGKFGEMPWAMACGYLAGCYVGEVLK